MRLPEGSRLTARGLLFDVDGTLIDSHIGVEKAWERWAARVGIDWPHLLANLHGRRMVDTIQRFAPPGVDVAQECAWVEQAELTTDDGIVPIAGARAFLESLPPECWMVVTSATRALALHRFALTGLPRPRRLLPGDEIQRGKPDPQGYALGIEALGCAASDTLVFEDARVGILAGRAAGARVLAIAGAERAEHLDDVDWIPDFSALSYEGRDARGQLVLRVGH
ncbi:HAD-IA family hydrolase [Melittangium boletus]|uniref:HAD-IA family hydrolase n=1 Tax=Melittangium boletus TaxID=83453 RepID=UPI003DA3963F